MNKVSAKKIDILMLVYRKNILFYTKNKKQLYVKAVCILHFRLALKA